MGQEGTTPSLPMNELDSAPCLLLIVLIVLIVG